MTINKNDATSTLSVSSTATNEDLNLTPKGTGNVKITANGLKFPDNSVQTSAASAGGGPTYGAISYFASSTPQTGFVPASGGSLVKASYPNLTGLLPDFNQAANLVTPASNNGAVTWNGSFFLFLTGANAYISSDGLTWTTYASVVPNAQWTSVVWNGTIFCAIGGSTNAVTSPDGITWTTGTFPAVTVAPRIAWNGTVFVAVSASGGNNYFRSTNGLTWTSISLENTRLGSNPIASNGSIFVVAGGGTGYVNTSTDGTNWTTRSLPISVAVNSVTWTGTTFLVLGYASSIAYAYTSTDGITWAAARLSIVPTNTSGFWGVVSNGSSVMAFAQSDPTFYLSYNLVTWYPVSASSFGVGTMQGMAGNSTRYIGLSTNASFNASFTFDSTKYFVPSVPASNSIPMIRVE